MCPARSIAIWCSHVADSWSSKCASSTPTTVWSPARMDSRADAMSAIGSRIGDEPTHWAKAPKGMPREVSVHAAQFTLARSDAVTVRARVVLPTPAGPTKIAPQVSPAPRAVRMASCSAGRSSNCQRRAMKSKCRFAARFPQFLCGATRRGGLFGQLMYIGRFEAWHVVFLVPEIARRLIHLQFEAVNRSQRAVGGQTAPRIEGQHVVTEHLPRGTVCVLDGIRYFRHPDVRRLRF